MSGDKYDKGKPRFTLIPQRALWEVVDVLEYGAQKYSADNWRKLDNLEDRYTNAMYRHMREVLEGKDIDPESGKYHLAHAICSLMFLLEVKLEVQDNATDI